jgi:flagella basal body P-ring formation protein FlgA
MNVSAAVAGSYQSHKSIYQAAESFILKQVQTQHSQRPDIKASGLDSRLKLKKCNKSLRAFLPKGSREMGRTTVGVKCTGTKPWSLHVPVTISIYKNVLVASRTLQKGDVLTKADVKLAKHDIGSLSYGFFENTTSGIGMKIKRRAQAGTVLTPSMLKKQQVIKRGQKVSITAQSGRMQIKMMGEALNNGAVGDRIKVMNIKSRRKLEGIVTSSAEVKVDI